MSGPIMTPDAVMRDERLTLAQKVVYGKIFALHFFGSRKRCDARNGTLAENTGLTKGTVANAISELHKLGHLDRDTYGNTRVLIPVEGASFMNESGSLTDEGGSSSGEGVSSQSDTIEKTNGGNEVSETFSARGDSHAEQETAGPRVGIVPNTRS